MSACVIARRRFLTASVSVALSGCAGTTRTLWPSAGPDEGFTIYQSQFDDTLVGLAQSLHLGYVELAAANPDVDPWAIAPGTALRIPRFHLLPDGPRAGVLVNVGDMRLYYFSDMRGVDDFPIGIGREGHLTPLGSTRIVRKKADPTWYPPLSIRREQPELEAVIPPGPDNPLGAFALYLDWPAYLIHGTNAPASVGRRASNGCIRLYPEDIAYLFAEARQGLHVTVVDQPVKIGWQGDALFVEAHPSQSQATEIEETGAFTEQVRRTDLIKIGAEAASRAKEIDWRVAKLALRERRGYPVRLL